MDDAMLTEAGKKIMDASPVYGPMLVILGLTIIALVIWIRSILKDKDARTDAHLEDVRRFAGENEQNRTTIAANTEQIRANTQTMTTMIEVIRERERARG